MIPEVPGASIGVQAEEEAGTPGPEDGNPGSGAVVCLEN